MLSFDSVLRPDVVKTAREHGGAPIEQALRAVRRLAGAAGGSLYAYHRTTGELEVISGNPVAGARIASPIVRSAMKAETAFLLADSRPRWVEEGSDEDLLVKLLDGSSRTVFLALGFGKQSAADRAQVMRLVPDLALLMRCQVDLDARLRELEEQKAAVVEALDHGECGTIAVRADHSVIFANEAATRHLRQEVGLRVRRGVVRPVDHASAIRFDAALESVLDTRSRQSALPPAYLMLLPATAQARPTIIVIAPARRLQEGLGGQDGAVAIISLLEQSNGAMRGIDALCSLHGLSRVESRLMSHLTSGLTLNEAAAEMCIKIETARTYLKQIFAKTGLHRQTDLIALMTRYLRAIRGGFEFQPA